MTVVADLKAIFKRLSGIERPTYFYTFFIISAFWCSVIAARRLCDRTSAEFVILWPLTIIIIAIIFPITVIIAGRQSVKISVFGWLSETAVASDEEVDISNVKRPHRKSRLLLSPLNAQHFLNNEAPPLNASVCPSLPLCRLTSYRQTLFRHAPRIVI